VCARTRAWRGEGVEVVWNVVKDWIFQNINSFQGMVLISNMGY